MLRKISPDSQNLRNAPPEPTRVEEKTSKDKFAEMLRAISPSPIEETRKD